MAIEFVHADDAPYLGLVEVLASLGDGVASHFSEEERRSDLRRHIDGGPSSPQLFELRVPAGVATAAHAHVEDEIMYVLEGAAVFGRRSFPAGSAIHIPGGTPYAFRAGPEGLRFLNFRPCRDQSFVPVAELVSRARD